MSWLRWRVFREVTAMALRDYLRTPDAVFWTYGFPLGMAVVLGLAFGEKPPDPSRIVLLAEPAAESSAWAGFEKPATDGLAVERSDDAARAHDRLILGAIDAVLSGTPDRPVIDVDVARPGAALAELRIDAALRRARGEPEGPRAEIRPVDEPGGRYIDFLIPGLIGINLLGAGIYGVGYNMVQMRVKNLLRRIHVTPVGRAEFLLSWLASRFGLSLLPPFLILLFGILTFGVPVASGAWSWVVALIVASAFCFGGLGLLISTRARTTETVGGLMNLIMLPMWLGGGAFFSNQRFPEFAQPLVKALPLTWVTDGLRDAMLGSSGEGFTAPVACLLLAGFGAVTCLVSFRIFRWT